MHVHFKKINSTSVFLRENSEQFRHGDWVSADYQSAGHGQVGNSWESEREKNVLFSLMLRPLEVLPQRSFVLTEIVTLGTLRALTEIVPEVDVKIKWPNDIYVGDRKLSGILIESSMMAGKIDSAVVGMGLNVNQLEFKSDAPNPVSLAQLTGREFDVRELMGRIVECILEQYKWYCEKGDVFHQEYLDKLYRRGEWAWYERKDGERFEGKIEDVEPNGLLVMRKKSDEIEHFEFKSIKYILWTD